MQLLLAALCFVAGVVITGIVRMLPGFLPDHANERSAHRGVVPRGGGLGIALPSLLSAIALSAFEGRMSPAIAGFLLGGTALLLLGVLDDARGLGAVSRLVTETVVAAAVVFAFLPSELRVGFGDLAIAGPAARLLQVLAIVAGVNFFNFMDGVDGFAGIGAALALVVFSVLLSPGGSQAAERASLLPISALPLCAAAATAGFLVWNLPPASVFMGDGGSYFLGFLLTWVALCLVVATPADPAPVSSGAFPRPGLVTSAAVLFPFIIDPTMTLLIRVRRGQNPLRAHRDHLYQIMYDSGYSVGGIVALLLLCNLALLAAIAAGDTLGGRWAALLPGGMMLLLTVAYGVLRAAIQLPRREG